MNFRIMTLFPEALSAYTDSSILGRAQKAGYIDIKYFNIRRGLNQNKTYA